MSGETSKVTGDLGENGTKEFLKLLGWTPRSATSFDFDCAIQGHKTPSSREKSGHGIDFIYSYSCPYSRKEKIILVDSKAIKWGTTQGKIKNISSISNEISGYISELHEKTNCSLLSKDFKQKIGVSSFKPPVGLILYYSHDGYFRDELFKEVLEGVSLPKDDYSSKIYILSNNRLNMLLSVFRHIEKEKLKLGKGANHKFCYFELERHPLEGTQREFVTIQSLFSNFIFVKITDTNNSVSNHVYYFGSYEHDSIKMFVSALYRFQIHLMDNLTFYPISMHSPLGNMNGIETYFKDNKLIYEDKEVSIKLGKIDPIEYRLTI